MDLRMRHLFRSTKNAEALIIANEAFVTRFTFWGPKYKLSV